ncbi:MAG: trypsin-like peptidase domain-containing protein [Pseudomonadota bacterium]|nr:trypsin-like peptidase domain-containing protein [Pseudomonadota bacterium]
MVTIKANRTTGSAVEIEPDFFVTNKHVVTDKKKVLAQYRDGRMFFLHVVPNVHKADLVFLSRDKNKKPPVVKIPSVQSYDGLRVVAYGIGRGSIRVFPTGRLLALPPEEKPQARIHTTLRNLPGISGGALINGAGRLVGIVTAGSGKYNEAIAVEVINEISQESMVSSADYINRGRHIKFCSNLLSIPISHLKSYDKSLLLKEIETECSKADTKTLYDVMGQVFGKLGLFEKSVLYLKKSVFLDPNSPTSLISLAIAFQFQKAYKDQLEILNHLLDIIPEDPLVLRMAVQAGALSQNKVFTEKALKFLGDYNPAALPQAFEFVKKRTGNN